MTTETLNAKVVGTKMFRTCVDCGQSKHRFKSFRPRKSRCVKHKGRGTDAPADCKACEELRNHITRQPRCIECDSVRSAKKSKAKIKAGKKNPVVVKAKKPGQKKAKKAAAQPAPAQVQVPAPVSAPQPIEAPSVVDTTKALLGSETAPPVMVPAQAQPEAVEPPF